MKILLTGGTGFVGQVLAERLIKAGHELVFLSRNAQKAEAKLSFPGKYFNWSPEKEPPPAEAFEGVESVVHLAGESVAEGRWTAKKRERILKSRTESTKNMVQGMQAAGSQAKSFVCASAIGYYGNPGDVECDEGSAKGTGFLSDVCDAWEKEAQKASARTVCLRIGMVLGRKGALAKLLPLFRFWLGGPVGNGQQWMSWIHVEDVARLVAYAIENESLSGPVNTVAPAPVTNAVFTKSLAKAMKVPAILPAPAFALKIALGQMSELALNSQKILPKAALSAGFSFSYPDIDSALGEICSSVKKKSEKYLKVHQYIPVPVEKAFEFHSDAKNLQRITPPWLNFNIVSGADEPVREGLRLTYKLRIHGVPLTWVTQIQKWNPVESFVDTQEKGPYSLWHHTHRFFPVQGGTLIEDEVRYLVPLGVFGELAAGWLVKRDVDEIFRHRRQKIREIIA